MDTQHEYKTVKIPLFNSFNGLNNFRVLNNKFIIEQQINESSTINNDLAGIATITTNIRHEFILPEKFSKNIDFESDLTITYKIINNKLHLINIDALYAEDYIENIESNLNVYPIYSNGSINYSLDDHNTLLNATNYVHTFYSTALRIISNDPDDE